MKLEDLLRFFEDRVKNRFFGKSEGVVTDNADPLQVGRLRARVPSVLGQEVESGWALPCAPCGGGPDRGFLSVPEIGDTVWIEFAAGDLSRPIWSGVFWSSPEDGGSEVPTSDGIKAGPGHHVLRTKAGHRLYLDDEGGIVVLANGTDGAEVRLTSNGEVVVTAGKIKLGEAASQAVIHGDEFLQLFNQHIHPTGVGPSGPPQPNMPPSQLSTKTFTE